MPAQKNNAALLERRLTLVSWFAGVLGYDSNAEMLGALKDADCAWGESYHQVLARVKSENRRIDAATWQRLEELDNHIREDWAGINRNRKEPLSLKYFQYLAALSSALFLSRLAESAESLRRELNSHAVARGGSELERFDDDDELCKLAFWMATGSGKTLLLHLHYRQFFRYGLFAADNVLLITPNETLSRQHIAELEASGIPCFRHNHGSNLLSNTSRAVRVIEITKIISPTGKRLKSKGESVPVEAFSGRNLLLVDEGHKGAGGDEWFAIRDALAKNTDRHGFTFEYSATFGQALSADLLAGAPPAEGHKRRGEYDRAKKYARAILVDYSYRYFHGDGYGKDFKVLNINTDPADGAAADLLMLGNLLSFFQQQQAWKNNEAIFAADGIEKPLLLLLGATVGGGDDTLRVLAFLHRVAADKDESGRAWLQQAAEKILNGASGIMDGDERDVFAEHFDYLQQEFPGGNNLPQALRETLFYASASGALRFSAVKQAKNEAALRVGENEPFALVYVGDSGISTLSNKVKAWGVEVADDVIQTPLFAGAHLSSSCINILIGAKKFMEGWSSWRVCGIGLLNLGRSEGTQIIQLFGRGVRLKGRDFSLKRSSAAMRKTAPKTLPLLETLNIFAIRANFMTKFYEYLQREGVSKTMTITIEINDKHAREKELQVLQFPPPADFAEVVEMPDLKHAADLTATLDYGVRAQTIASDDFAGQTGVSDREPVKFTPQATALLDIDELYRQLLTDKWLRKQFNLIPRREALETILQKHCDVIGGEAVFAVKTYADWRRLQAAAFFALCKYAKKLYYRRLKKWQSEHAEYMPLFAGDGAQVSDNFVHYEICVSAEDEELIQKIRQLINNRERLYYQQDETLPRIPFERHLYLPLLLYDAKIIMSPPGLNGYEAEFVRLLKNYIERGEAENKDVFLLRNAGRGKGVGFYEDEGFFPDFILWVVDGDKQRLVFIEPHGMLHAPAYQRDFKARLWKKLRDLSAELKKQYPHIDLDAYIISITKYEILKTKYDDGSWSREDFKERHILFFNEGDTLIKHIIDAR